MQPEDIASAGTAVQAQLNAEADLSEEFGLLSAAEVARRAAPLARNTSALATRWRAERRVFSVPVRPLQRYPGFMFDEHGQPLVVIAEVMEAASHLGGWGLALWFTEASERLGGARPVDRLSSDAGAVLAGGFRGPSCPGGTLSPGRGAVQANIDDWAAGRLIVRCHPDHRAATEFNVTTASQRFRPIYQDERVGPTLFGSESFAGALAETVLHDVPVRAQAKRIS